MASLFGFLLDLHSPHPHEPHLVEVRTFRYPLVRIPVTAGNMSCQGYSELINFENLTFRAHAWMVLDFGL